MKMSTRKSFLSIILILMFILSGCMGSIDTPEHDFKGDNIEPPVKFRTFELVDSNAEPFNSTDISGQVLVIAFLFTNCPDICPIISSNLNWLTQQLGDEVGNNVTIMSITVDPWRDSPAVFAEYMVEMNLSWPHLTVNDTENEIGALENVWEDFGVGLQIVENGSNDTSARHHPMDYDVDHSTGTVLVDKNGMQRVWWADLDWMPELVLEDVRYLLNE